MLSLVLPPIWMVSFFNSLGCCSQESDNTTPGSSAGGDGRSEPVFDQRNRSPRPCQRFLAGGFL